MPAISRGAAGFAASILQAAADTLAPFLEPIVNYMPTGRLCVNGQSVANATTTNAIQINWPCDGYLVGIAATTRDGVAASQAGSLVRVVVDGNLELFTTGTAPGYVPVSQLTGVAIASWRTRVTFRQATPWQLYINNTTATNPIVYDICFDYINVTTPRPQ
jgi:hypothetical protein